MSPRKSNESLPTPAPAGLHRKPRPDLYTVLLVIALVAVLLGILFLYLEMQRYEFKINGAPMVGMAMQWVVGDFCRFSETISTGCGFAGISNPKNR